MMSFKRGWMVRSLVVAGMLGMGSSAVAPEARAMGAALGYYQAHQVSINCFIKVGAAVLSPGLGTGLAAGKCLFNILASSGSGSGGGGGGGSQKPGARDHKPVAGNEQIAFHSIEEFLAHPRVSKQDKELVRSQYLPAIKQVESEIQVQIKLARAQLKGTKVSEQVAEERVRKAVTPLIERLSAPLASKGIKVVIK